MDKHPLIPDPTANFLYLRLQRTAEAIETGYAKPDLATWAQRARAFADGGVPADLTAARACAREGQARRVHLHDLGRQGAGAGRRAGALGAAEVAAEVSLTAQAASVMAGLVPATGVFGFIAAAIVVVFVVIGAFGPATTRRRLEAIAG